MKHLNDFIDAVEAFTLEHHLKRGNIIAVRVLAKQSLVDRLAAELCDRPISNQYKIAISPNPTFVAIMTSVGPVDVRPSLDEGFHVPFMFEVDYPPADPDWD